MQYGEFAYIYDRLIHADIDYDKWCDYIENFFAAHECEPQTICELACGTGNITSRLVKRGYDITGVDISADMLTAAADKLHGTRLICCDMSRFATHEKFDAALCMIDGINYVLLPEALQKTFNNVRGFLSENGIFIFDISTEYKLKNIIGNNTFIHSEYDVFYSWQNEYHEKHNISDMLLNFFVREGENYARFEENHKQRGWTVPQIKTLLRRAGFDEIHAYDELTTSIPRPDSERIVFVCK